MSVFPAGMCTWLKTGRCRAVVWACVEGDVWRTCGCHETVCVRVRQWTNAVSPIDPLTTVEIMAVAVDVSAGPLRLRVFIIMSRWCGY